MSIARIFLVTLAALLGASANANWVIQVGAFTSEPTSAFSDRARALGPAYLQHRSDGTIAVNIGPWNDYDDAQRELPAVRREFQGAFIKRYRGSGSASAGQKSAASLPTSSANGNDNTLINELAEQERHNVVLLDGELHYKQGDEFTPLREYLLAR